ncbi:MAG TPA: hypothetical protein VNP73_01620, partial [Actinomycetota bacterium]|nr:hypothetical protein [Actinomycetota bacterium]
MVPPIEQGVLDRPYVITAPARARTPRLTLRERVSLTDLWAVLSLVWLSRFLTGPIRFTELAFGVAAFLMISSPTARPERLTPSALDDVSRIFTRIWLAYAGICAASVAFGLGAERELLMLAVPMAPAVIGGRMLSYGIERRVLEATKKKRVLVVGSGEAAERVVETIATHDEYGLDLVGAATDGDTSEGSRLRSVTLGETSAAENLIDQFEIDVVIVASDTQGERGLSRVLRSALAGGAEVWIVPRFFELGCPSSGDHLWGLPVVRVQPPAQSRSGWSWKRAMDVVVSAIVLVLISPILAAIAL